ncbi:hypothetical protein Taro_006610 [Colocasia esculenta]|uniref:FLZ-type domain-containing protein n=1 Tax=Colocasia esculenta TaxID=4460 RepID=A0A843TT56_COLES|nr:hypothetical protein [Colocasia esculenta]
MSVHGPVTMLHFGNLWWQTCWQAEKASAMMLRKRSRPAQHDHNSGQLMMDSSSETSFSSDAVRKPRNTSFFSLPGIFVGFAKGMADSDSARSPMSPLDYKVFSTLGSHFSRSPRSPGFEGPRKSWDCDRVGLGLVDSLNDESKTCGTLLGSSESRNILFGSHMKINIPSPKTHLDHLLAEGPATSPKSLPKNYVVSPHHRIGSPLHRSGSSETGPELPAAEPAALGKIHSCSADMGGRSFLLRRNLSSEVIRYEPKMDILASPSAGGVDFQSSSGSLPITHGLVCSLSASDIELSEDYTCVISHGPNPKTTYIFGDCILETHTNDLPDFVSINKQGEEKKGSSWIVKCSEDPVPFPSEDFLNVCYSCKKKLDGEDIYMYRGEKAFCSCSCRSREIMIEEEMEENPIDSSGTPS